MTAAIRERPEQSVYIQLSHAKLDRNTGRMKRTKSKNLTFNGISLADAIKIVRGAFENGGK